MLPAPRASTPPAAASPMNIRRSGARGRTAQSHQRSSDHQVAAPGHGLDQVAVLAQRLAQHRHLEAEIALVDEDRGPDMPHDLRLRDDLHRVRAAAPAAGRTPARRSRPAFPGGAACGWRAPARNGGTRSGAVQDGQDGKFPAGTSAFGGDGRASGKGAGASFGRLAQCSPNRPAIASVPWCRYDAWYSGLGEVSVRGAIPSLHGLGD